MRDLFIIDLYKKGYSIKFITKKYYDYINSSSYYDKSSQSFLRKNKNQMLLECKRHVLKVLIDYTILTDRY